MICPLFVCLFTSSVWSHLHHHLERNKPSYFSNKSYVRFSCVGKYSACAGSSEKMRAATAAGFHRDKAKYKADSCKYYGYLQQFKWQRDCKRTSCCFSTTATKIGKSVQMVSLKAFFWKLGSSVKLISIPLSFGHLCLKQKQQWDEGGISLLCILYWHYAGRFWVQVSDLKCFPRYKAALRSKKLENTQCCWHLQYKGSRVAILKYRHLDNDLSSGRVNHMWTCPVGLFTLNSAATVS